MQIRDTSQGHFAGKAVCALRRRSLVGADSVSSHTTQSQHDNVTVVCTVECRTVGCTGRMTNCGVPLPNDASTAVRMSTSDVGPKEEKGRQERR